MYDCIRTAGPLASAYFITLILMGNIVMLNLFLAILLGNFDKARISAMKQKIVDAFEEKIIKKNLSIEKSLNMIFPDLPLQLKNFLLNKKASQPGSPRAINSARKSTLATQLVGMGVRSLLEMKKSGTEKTFLTVNKS